MSIESIVKARSPRARGYIDWTPKQETQDLLDAIGGVLVENADYLPLTARQIFYQLVARQAIGKTERDYKRLCENLVKARRSGIIPFEHIRDDGVTEIEPPPAYNNAGQVVATAQHILENAVFDPDTAQACGQLVLCEAAGMASQLARVAGEFGVSVISSGGFNSLTAKHDLAKRLSEEDRPVIVWHLGDFDPSGVHVFQSLAEDITALAGDDAHVHFRRLCVTEDQIEQHNLIYAPAKVTDRRTFDGAGTVQCEALPPSVLAQILRDTLEDHFDRAFYEAARRDFEHQMLRHRERLS